jgi:hypothetical protein
VGPATSGFLTEVAGERTAFFGGAGIALLGMAVALLARSSTSIHD